jgi:uncharacterized repeat protein (TIGR01451 family)
MRGTIRWSLGGTCAVAIAAWAIFALSAPAQFSRDDDGGFRPPPATRPLNPFPTGQSGIPGGMSFGSYEFPEPKLLPEVMPKGPTEAPTPHIVDPNVQPAQAIQPGSSIPPAVAPRTAPVPDPPAPMVRIQVRVPADSPPGDDLKYIITVQNTSSADAHGVTVRNPLNPDAIDQVVKADPECDKTKSTEKELVWSFGTLAPGKSKTIELTLRPKANATEVKNLAYVRFEHGQAVTTKINKPAVKVTKIAPKQSVRDEPYTVRITVENTGKVHAEDVRVVENLPPTAEFEPITKGAKRTDKRDAPPGPEGQQWVWEIPKLMPGERKIIEYRVTAREAKDVYTLTSLAASKGTTDRAEARTLVLVPGLTVKLVGPPANALVNPGEPAKYEITVRNAGTLTSTNIRVTGTLPADCKPTKKTEGGQLYRDAIQWTVPKLEAGEAQTFRFEVKASTSGRRIVVASVADARGQRAADELATHFQGTAALVWESVPNPVALSVGKQGTFTVKVRNNGGEAARNVRVEVEMPDSVSMVQVTPKVPSTGNKLVFGGETIAGYGEATYTITYEARQPSQAWFKLKMTADCLSDRPMQTEKAIEITGGK